MWIRRERQAAPLAGFGVTAMNHSRHCRCTGWQTEGQRAWVSLRLQPSVPPPCCVGTAEQRAALSDLG